MIMIVHETICMNDAVVLGTYSAQDFKKVLTVNIVKKNSLLGIPSGSYMIDRPGIFYSQWSRHKFNITNILLYCKTWPLWCHVININSVNDYYCKVNSFFKFKLVKGLYCCVDLIESAVKW